MSENNKLEVSIKSDAEGGVSGERLYRIYAAKICADLINKHPQQVDINLINYIFHPEFDELPDYYETGENRHKISASSDRTSIVAASFKETKSNIEEAIAAQKRLTAFENQKELQRIVRGTMLTLIKSDIVYAPQKNVEYFEEVSWEYSLDKCKLTPNAYSLLSKDFSGELKEEYDKYRTEHGMNVVENSKASVSMVEIFKQCCGGAGGLVGKGISKATEDLVSKGILVAMPTLATALLGFLG